MDFTPLPAETLRAHKGKSFVGVSTAFICHDGQGKIFMAKRSVNTRDEQGTWDCGGGGLKMGVSALENVRREVKEEYGAEALKITFVNYRDVFRTMEGIPTQWLALDFVVLIDPQQVKIGEPDMIDDSGWFSMDDLPQPLHSVLPKFFAQNRSALEAIMRQQNA